MLSPPPSSHLCLLIGGPFTAQPLRDGDHLTQLLVLLIRIRVDELVILLLGLPNDSLTPRFFASVAAYLKLQCQNDTTVVQDESIRYVLGLWSRVNIEGVGMMFRVPRRGSRVNIESSEE